jgi:enoyl-CoA hydratase/carnithine racemase
MVVGAIHGWAVGGGLEWVINCDFVVMAQSCRFFFSEISLGVFVTGGVTRLLVEQIGLQNARKMILLGERYSASDAVELGFSWQIAGDDEVTSLARSLAQQIAVLPAGPVKNLKQALRESPTANLESAMALETQATLEGFLDPLSADRVRNRLS